MANQIEGWNEFIADLKDMPRRIERDMRATMRGQANRIVARAAAHAAAMSAGSQRKPPPTGKMAGNTSVRVGPWRVTITWLEPYAGVQEFGREYTRTGARGGVVRMSQSEPPRFAYKAWLEMRDTFSDELLDAVAHTAASGGFWQVTN